MIPKHNPNLQERLNHYGRARTPILFVISYDMSDYTIIPLADLNPAVQYSIDNSQSGHSDRNRKIPYTYHPVSKERYQKAFETIQSYIRSGHTYLANLTFPSHIEIDYSLEEIYRYADARFKLLFKDRFVCFSPERFVKIVNDTLYTHPMKGTIDATIPDAESLILANEKEMAEHTMVVDLLRNDLAMVSKGVTVDRFRYIEKIKAGERELLQVSSQIRGQLRSGWQDRLGNILTKLLPAGSITGTPKKRTCEIIEEVERYDRGFYSGVFGVFDGESLDSAVMIRFIEKQGDKLIYKSGGGITIDSDCEAEYQEMCEKIYVPFL